MKIKNLHLTITVIILTAGCGTISNLFTSSPDISIKKEFDGNGIAVLNFSKIGPVSGEICKIAADKLTDDFYLISKFNVIDRSKVNEAQINLEITNSELLSSEQIQKLGRKLKANYLVLGRVHCITSENFMESENNNQLNVSFRIISVANQEIIGIAYYSCEYEDNMVEKLQSMLSKIASKISNID
jgi:TolB-like protein